MKFWHIAVALANNWGKRDKEARKRLSKCME